MRRQQRRLRVGGHRGQRRRVAALGELELGLQADALVGAREQPDELFGALALEAFAREMGLTKQKTPGAIARDYERLGGKVDSGSAFGSRAGFRRGQTNE